MTLSDYLFEAISKHALVRDARTFAQDKHKGQTRKDGTPYFSHPDRVAKFVAKNKQSKHLPELVSAAYLHDTIEDTDATINEVREKFGDLVASLVTDLTSDQQQKIEMGKTDYLTKKMLEMSDYALVVKLCDRLDNISDLKNSENPEFVNKYVKETKSILERLKTREITKIQQRIINQIQKKLSNLKVKE